MKCFWLSLAIVLAVTDCAVVCRKKTIEDVLEEFDEAYEYIKKKYGVEKLRKIGFEEVVYGK